MFKYVQMRRCEVGCEKGEAPLSVTPTSGFANEVCEVTILCVYLDFVICWGG
jgi:hypothetical protein